MTVPSWLSATHHHHRHFALSSPPPSGFAWTAMTRLVEQKPIIVGATLIMHRVLQREMKKRQQRESSTIIHRKNNLYHHRHHHLSAESNDDVDVEETEQGKFTEQSTKKPVTKAMVASIGFYKRFISPLLPPACRFLPTCSQYGVQAIEEFGPSKGAILTAWRLLRCSPLGGKGYDPPRWPPVEFTYSSY